MKSTYKKPTYLLLTTLVVLGFLLPHTTHAGMIADIALLLPGYIVSWIVLPIMSLLVYASGMLLNLSIDMSVVNMADSVKSAGINEIWAVIRDVANMGFIFMLIYTSIMTIFGKGDYQKVIRNTIIAALLINFSLFLTKAVIDASNLIALFFYNAISPGGISTIKGISSSFMDVLGISNLYKGVDAFEGSKLVIIGIGGAVIYLITAFSFLAVAALFIIRFVILMLLMVLSPLMFIGSIIPYLKDKADMWWNALVSQSLFGPIYFMLTWVTLKIAQAMFTGGTGDLSSTGSSTPRSIGSALVGVGKGGTYVADPDAMGVLLKFIIVIAFMITSLLAAKKMAEKVGGGITEKAIGWTGGAFFGSAVGGLGRNTVGRFGKRIADNPNLTQATKKSGMAGAGARLALFASKKAASGSFDARRASVPTRSIAEGLGMAAGGVLDRDSVRNNAVAKRIGLGNFDVNKYEAALHRNVEEHVPTIDIGARVTKKVGTGEGEAGGFRERKDADEKKDREFIKDRAKEQEKAENKVKISAGEEEVKKKTAGTTFDQAKIDDMVGVLKKMSEDDIKTQKASVLALQDVAEALSQKQIESIQKSNNYTAPELKGINDSRGKRMKDAFAAGGTVHIPATATTPARTGYEEAQRLMKKMEAPTLAKMGPYDPADLTKQGFDHPEILDMYTPGILGKLARQNEFTTEKMDKIRDAIINKYNNLVAAGTPPPAGSNLQKSWDWLVNKNGADIYS